MKLKNNLMSSKQSNPKMRKSLFNQLTNNSRHMINKSKTYKDEDVKETKSHYNMQIHSNININKAAESEEQYNTIKSSVQLPLNDVCPTYGHMLTRMITGDEEQYNSIIIQTKNDKETLVNKCRICFESSDNEDSTTKLISPCKCKGSTKYLHHKCILHWLKESKVWTHNQFPKCEYCLFEYQAVFYFQKLSSNPKIHNAIENIVKFSIILALVLCCLLIILFIILDSIYDYSPSQRRSLMLILTYVGIGILVVCVIIYVIIIRKEIYILELDNWNIINFDDIDMYQEEMKKVSQDMLIIKEYSYPYVFNKNYMFHMIKQ